MEIIKRAELRDREVILDVACGNGSLLEALSKKAKVEAFGIDISENLIGEARRRCPQLVFAAQSCFPLEFEDESKDVITVSCAFHHFENPQGFADESMRVLKDGGRIYMVEPYFSQKTEALGLKDSILMTEFEGEK